MEQNPYLDIMFRWLTKTVNFNYLKITIKIIIIYELSST